MPRTDLTEAEMNDLRDLVDPRKSCGASPRLTELVMRLLTEVRYLRDSEATRRWLSEIEGEV